jgi:Na+/melibiose symporter-like transporter
MNTKAMKLPFWKKVMYALGQFGWSLTSFAVGNLLVYFYLPPETGESTFEPFFFQGSVFLGLTIIGLIFAIGRVFDAVTDPVIAGLSDRGKFKFGRRRTFLAISIVPFAVLSVLAFIPPVGGVSTVNAIFVSIVVLLFYLFMTMYVTPFFALLSEIGHTPNERLQLSTMISITWAIGFAFGSQVYLFQSIFEGMGYSSVNAFRVVVGIFALVGFIFMLLPIIFIDESKYSEAHVSEEGIFESVRTAFGNKNFLKFTLSDLSYWVSMTTISSGLIYYVTILLKEPKETASFLQLMMFGVSFLFYVPTNIIAKRVGKKRLLLVGFVAFLITFSMTFLLGRVPLSSSAQVYIFALVAAVPLAIFGILPNAMVADIAEADGIKTGNFKAGIFFGARTFMSKMGQSVAGIIFPSLLLLGRSVDNPIGVLMTAGVAILFLIGGLVLLVYYNEDEINETLKSR